MLRQELDYKASLSEWLTTKDGAVEYRRHCRKPYLYDTVYEYEYEYDCDCLMPFMYVLLY